jgi:hypothetical protein
LILLIGIFFSFNQPTNSQNNSTNSQNNSTNSQNNSTISPTTVAVANDIFRVGITLFGVDNQTGNVFSFVKVNNITAGRFFNASREDMATDNNGVVESTLSFPNQTILKGERYIACNIALVRLKLNCSQGFNSPSVRAEYAQFALKWDKIQ